jgi:hypothetical protein
MSLVPIKLDFRADTFKEAIMLGHAGYLWADDTRVRCLPCPLSCLDSASLLPPFVKRIERRCAPVFFHHSLKGRRE